MGWKILHRPDEYRGQSHVSPGLPRGLQAALPVLWAYVLERLWCLLEIFVYLEMGGRVDDVTLVLAPPDDAYFEERFARFDVSHAKCFDPVERDRLLATIEAGFGGLDQFNASLKGVVADLLKRAADDGDRSPCGRRRRVIAGNLGVGCRCCRRGFTRFLQFCV